MLSGGTLGASCKNDQRKVFASQEDDTYRATIAHHVRRDDPQAQVGEERNLVTPTKGQVWPSVNEEYSSLELAIFWQG